MRSNKTDLFHMCHEVILCHLRRYCNPKYLLRTRFLFRKYLQFRWLNGAKILSFFKEESENVWSKKWLTNSIVLIFELHRSSMEKSNGITQSLSYKNGQVSEEATCVCAVLPTSGTQLNACVRVVPRLKCSEFSLWCITAGRPKMIYSYRHCIRSILSRMSFSPTHVEQVCFMVFA